MFRFGCSVVIAFGLIQAAAAAAPPEARKPLPTAAFAEIPGLEGPDLSPNGQRIAAKLAVEDEQLFAVVPVTGAKPLFIGLGESDLNWWQWVNDDWLVVGIGQLLPVEGDQWYVSRAVAVNAVSGKIVNLATHDAGQTADDLIWTASDGTPRILMASQRSIYRNQPGFFPSVDEIDVSTGKRKTVVQGREGVWDWYADGHGTVRMGVGMSDDGRSKRVLYREGPRALFRTIDRARAHTESLLVPALFLKDPTKALTIEDDEQGYSALYELDLTTLQRGRQVFATKGYDINGLVRSTNGFDLLGIRTVRERPEVHWLDPQMQAIQAAVTDLVKGGQPHIVSVDRARSVAVVRVGGADAPGAYYLFYPARSELVLLQHNNKAIGMKRMHAVATIRYKARDGLEIAAVLTLPYGRGSNLPLIVMPHGGPFARDSEDWDWWTQFLADRGYAVVQPNYRGSSGYGTPFTKMGAGQWGLAMQDDLNDAVTELAKQGIVDPRRVCMVGASYGGYAALRAAQRNPKLYRCAVSYAGVSDVNRMLQYNHDFLGSGARRDWLRAQAPDLKAVSPIHYPQDFGVPVLLAHGGKDRVVPPVQSRAMAHRLKQAGKPVTYIDQPKADHHFSRSKDRQQFLEALEAFLKRHNPA